MIIFQQPHLVLYLTALKLPWHDIYVVEQLLVVQKYLPSKSLLIGSLLSHLAIDILEMEETEYLMIGNSLLKSSIYEQTTNHTTLKKLQKIKRRIPGEGRLLCAIQGIQISVSLNFSEYVRAHAQTHTYPKHYLILYQKQHSNVFTILE